MDEGEELNVSKVMSCSPHLIAAILKLRGRARVGLCQPGASSWWSVCMDDHDRQIVDLAFYQGQLYGLNSQDRLFAVDISVDETMSNPWVSKIRLVINKLLACPYLFLNGFFILKTTYLVESRGALLVVCRKAYLRLKGGRKYEAVAAEKNTFEVFEADLGQSQWSKMATLGDNQVLFLRRRCCRSVCVSHNEMPGDHIFFVENDEETHCWYPKDSLSSCSIYDMRDGKVSTPLPMVSWKPGRVFATWLFPQN